MKFHEITRNKEVLKAMRNTPRHRFVPEKYKKWAYEDRPLPIGHDQTISQPYIVALMTDLLALKGDGKVLEIGTGSGYQAAILAKIVDTVCNCPLSWLKFLFPGLCTSWNSFR